MHFNKSLNFECLNRGPLKRIFYWTRFWKSDSFEFGVGVRKPFELHNCPVTNCQVTNDQTLFNSSDLVLFHALDFLKHNQRFPTHQPSGQRWVFVYSEPPNRNRFDDLCYKKLSEKKFNTLNTYHIDSEYNSIYYSNANFEWKTNYSFDPTFDYHGTIKQVLFIMRKRVIIQNCNFKFK